MIKKGENKITSKIVCNTGEGNPSVSSDLKHYSVNVTGYDNNSTASPSPLSTKNTSGHSDTAPYSSYNGTVFVIPMPNDLLLPPFQSNNLDNNEVVDSNDNLEDHANNSPDGGDDDGEDDNGDQDNSGKGKGKAKGHGKNKG
jgi:hypothetical protein